MSYRDSYRGRNRGSYGDQEGRGGQSRGFGGPPRGGPGRMDYNDDRRAFVGGPPPSARGRGGPRFPGGSGDSYRGSYPQRGGRGSMPPPQFPPRGRGWGGGPPSSDSFPPMPVGNSGPPRSREASPDSERGRDSGQRSLAPYQRQPSASGDGVSPASSCEVLSEAARQKKSHPIRIEADITTSFSKLTVRGNLRMPTRPDAGGQAGQPTQVVANCWDLEVTHKSVLMYFIEPIGVFRESKEPDGKRAEVRMPPKEKRALLQQVVDTLPAGTIYDGGLTLFTTKRLPGIEGPKIELIQQHPIKDPLNRDALTLDYRLMEVQNVSSGDVANFVASKNATSLEMPQESIRLLDCILKNICKGRFESLSRNALFYTDPVKVLHDKLFTIHKGFITSVRPQWKVRINVDMTCKAFFKGGNMADVMYEKYGDNWVKFQRQIAMDFKRIRVETTAFYKNDSGSTYSRRFSVHGLSSEPAGSLIIADLNQTVQEYFLKHHGITLQYPELPCVKVNQSRDVYIPMELLTVLPYQDPSAKKSEIASEVIRCAAIRPEERFRELQGFVDKMLQSNHPLVKEFGLKVSPRPVVTPARVLPTPNASFGRQAVPLGRGKWIAKSFHRPASTAGPIRWAILSLPPDRDAQRNEQMLINQLPNVARQFNVIFEQPMTAVIQRSELQQRFDFLRNKGINFVLLVLYDDFCYSTIKRLGDIYTGIRTQCVRGRTLSKPNVLPNLLLKINGKLGGINWQIQNMHDEKEHFMVFGADVTHPGPTQTHEVRQSIAAVLGSVTPDLMRYAAVVRQQATSEKNSRQTREIIDAMESSVGELLQVYLRNTNGRFPTRLIFYRDGVSEGQFENVLVEELSAIQRACSGIRPDYQPAITYIVVQKRHHIRFQPTNPRMRNVEPGTVVDTNVTHPREFDFYLCSQDGIQGTSKPAHYHVLYDDSDWSSDALQQFTFFLCHTYMRCSRSVSYPAPTYYAHLAAFRARDWVSDMDKNDNVVADGRFQIHDSQISGMYYL